MVSRIPEPRTILAVDDDPEVLMKLMGRLSAAGFHVQSATSGADAIRVIKARHVDSVILKVGLPGPVGSAQVAAAVREEGRGESVPVILGQPNGDAAALEQCKTALGAYFLVKPYEAEHVAQILEDLFLSDRPGEFRTIRVLER